ncbi:MAG: glycine--tRNA ligase [Candidatus Terrybacteria bacterium]|nr:glycine--tRNA ligase [Candidatus Terrybacteria bacterium]
MENKLEKIISLAKRRGFVYPGSEIYGGLAGTWDYGPLGAEMMHNIKEAWWKKFVSSRDDMYGIASSIIGPEQVWAASGHLEHFTDSLKKGKFNIMFKSKIGALKEETSNVYLRPELAQGMFVNFKNIIDSFHPKLPFGIAQIGRCFRNEISPRDFLFRVREFDLMEFEYFVREKDWEKYFEYWRKEMWNWIEDVGIDKNKASELEVAPENRAHYSKRTIDFEYDFPFGKKELYGLAYRTDHDLKNHKLDYYDEDTKERFVPHVIEPTFGVGRTILTILDSAYTEDELGGEKRVFLKFKPSVAPVKVAVFPLLKNKPELVNKAKEVYEMVKKEVQPVVFDDNGNIGKRYRRQDEIGTPFCVTIDFQTLDDNTITVRDRDTGKQERVKIEELCFILREKF